MIKDLNINKRGIDTNVPRYELSRFEEMRRFQNWVVLIAFVIPVMMFSLRLLILVIFSI